MVAHVIVVGIIVCALVVSSVFLASLVGACCRPFRVRQSASRL